MTLASTICVNFFVGFFAGIIDYILCSIIHEPYNRIQRRHIPPDHLVHILLAIDGEDAATVRGLVKMTVFVLSMIHIIAGVTFILALLAFHGGASSIAADVGQHLLICTKTAPCLCCREKKSIQDIDNNIEGFHF